MPEFFIPHFDTEAGKFYYVVDCPVTAKLLPFELDPSYGRTPYPSGPLIVSCAWCQEVHEILSPQVESLQAGKRR